MVLECYSCDTGLIRESGSNLLSKGWNYDYECQNCGTKFMLNCELKRNLKKMNEGWVMAEEQTVMVSSAKARARFYQMTCDKWVKEARAERKPICQSCMKWDYDKGQMGKREDYMKNITLVGSKEILNSNVNSANYGKKTGEMTDYACAKGHKMSIELLVSEMKNV